MSEDGAKGGGEFLLYAAPEGEVRVSVYFEGETAWLTQKALAELFGVKVPAIAKHLKNIFDSGELAEGSVVSILETTAADGKVYRTKHYSLDAIIAVGYRVNSYQATRFRIWATQVLREFMLKGFALDDERLKQGKALFGKDYFDELLERIVSAYLDLAENRAQRAIAMTMQDWAGFLDRFLKLSDYEVLDKPGRISALEAKLKAESEYEQFRVRQDRDYVSDFDKEVARLTGKDDR